VSIDDKEFVNKAYKTLKDMADPMASLDKQKKQGAEAFLVGKGHYWIPIKVST